MTRLLSSRDMLARFTMSDVIPMVEAAYTQESQCQVLSIPRLQLRSSQTQTFLNVLPALMPGMQVTGLNAYTGGNKGLGLVQKVILLFSTVDGRLLAMMEADWISWMRTGASSGVATKYLARQDAHCAGIFGAGKQARSQLMALTAVRPIERALVYSRTAERRELYAREMSKRLNIDVRAVESPEAVLREADVICTATSSPTPVFEGQFVRQGTHINAIGQHYPDRREVDSELVLRSRVVVDHRQRALQEDGEILIPLRDGLFDEEHIFASLGEIVGGTKVARTGDEITLFTSGGLAGEVLSVANGVYGVAQQEGWGLEVDWDVETEYWKGEG